MFSKKCYAMAVRLSLGCTEDISAKYFDGLEILDPLLEPNGVYSLRYNIWDIQNPEHLLIISYHFSALGEVHPK